MDAVFSDGPGAGVAWTEERSDRSDEGRQRHSGPGTRASGASAIRPGSSFEVVDWKTGAVPTAAAEATAAAVQLAAYRLAWARLAGVDVDRVGAAFVYVRHGVTVRPADLLDEAELVELISRLPAQ
jgi:hypothetical protein